MISQNYSHEHKSKKLVQLKKNWLWCLILPVWAYTSFMVSGLLVSLVVWLLVQAGVPLKSVPSVLLTTGISVVVWIVTVVMVTMLPYWLFGRKSNIKDLGVTGKPAWLDLVIPVPTFVAYFICSIMMAALAVTFLNVDFKQTQQLPFDTTILYSQAQYAMIFFTLVVLAPLAEELLFRGYLYTKLRKITSVKVSVIITSLTFGLAHLAIGSENLQWNVVLDTFVLSIFSCLLREYTGAVWASVVLHAIKNSLAFYLLFINPIAIHSAVGILFT